MKFATRMEPLTSKVYCGFETPTPTFPFTNILPLISNVANPVLSLPTEILPNTTKESIIPFAL